MKGYCEACKHERNSEEDEYGVDVCVDCGGDLVIGYHVENEYGISDDEAADFNDFLNRD